MYIICMTPQKLLITTKKENLFKGEKLVDKFCFYIPEKYGDIDISEYIVVLQYLNTNEVVYTDLLEKAESDKDGFSKYILPVDTNMTKESGVIEIRLLLSYVDEESKKQYVLRTESTNVEIQTVKDYYNFIPDESLNAVAQMIGVLQAKIDELNNAAEIYANAKADNIIREIDDTNVKIQLVANGKPIGNKISVNCTEDGVPIVDMNDLDVITL